MRIEELSLLVRQVAAREILPRFQGVRGQDKAEGSWVTETDLAVQQQLAAELHQRYPHIPLLGEEMPPEEQARLLRSQEVWCLDPLDGTSNYACGFPYFGISLALLRNGKAQLGLVYDPIRQECFTAERGKGAWCDGQPLQAPADRTKLKDCLALVDLKRLSPEQLMRLGADAPYRSQRNLGAVVLDWCWLAAGRAQLYLHGGQRLWDHAAGRLIAQEAGIASRLLHPTGTAVPDELALEPRLAIAAAGENLLQQWMHYWGLPSH